MNIVTRSFFIVVTAFILNIFIEKIISFFLNSIQKQSSTAIHSQRIDTLKSIFNNITSIIIYGVAILMVLNEFSFNIMPILTGAGILGIAISLGAQSLIKDFISGFFIILENQYNVGDEIKVGDLQGKVIRITFRTTILKDKHENTIHILNSEIKNTIVTKK